MGHIFLSFIFFNIILMNIYGHYKRGDYYVKKSDFIIYIILFILFGTYGGGEGDYYHYKDIVEEFNTLNDAFFYTGMEKQYVFLSYYVGGNYNLWRFVVCSIEFIGLGFFLYKAKLNTYPVLLCFTSFLLVTSVYGRSFWGSIYFFMGTYLLIEKKNPLYLIAIILCYFSHTQNIVLLILLPLAFIDIKKWHMVVVLLLMGTIATLVKDTFTSLLNAGGVEGADYLNGRMETYSEAERGNFGNSFGEVVVFFLRYLPVVAIVMTWLKIIFTKREKYLLCYKPYRRVVSVTIGVIITSLVMLLSSLGSGTFFYRILALSLFPIAILLPYMVEANIIRKKTFNQYVLVFIVLSEVGYIKDLYYAYANGLF